MKGRLAVLLAVALLAAPARAMDLPPDPLRSVMWEWMARQYLSDGRPIVFDPAVKVLAPARAEDPMSVPVSIDATGVPGASRILVFADLNPVTHILTYEPLDSAAWIAFRFKIEQATPVRAAVIGSDGAWHVGGTIVDAAGGGCTAPAQGRADTSWVDHLGDVQARIWSEPGSEARLRMRIRHPMDTGLAPGIPAFYVEALDVKAPDGRSLGRLELHQPVSENPTMTLRPRLPAGAGSLSIEGRDTEGTPIRATVPAPARSGALPLPDRAG
ncbi:MAG: quinoprotein dehydrogenase-associated SoxYZ-like carrier [Alsobacter sp.]